MSLILILCDWGLYSLKSMRCLWSVAAIAQLGERQTEDLEVPGSIPGFGIFIISFWFIKVNPYGLIEALQREQVDDASIAIPKVFEPIMWFLRAGWSRYD